MAACNPRELLLRCYAYKRGDNPYVGVCVDLNIAVQADTVAELREKMGASISSYIDTVLDTEDRASIAPLLERRAPLMDWMIYYLIKFIIKIRQFPTNFTFKEYIPFHLANHC